MSSNGEERELGSCDLARAVVMAMNMYDGVCMMDGKPLQKFQHNARVMEKVADVIIKQGVTDNDLEEYDINTILIASVLHDILKNSTCCKETLEMEFNWYLAYLVDNLTGNFRDEKGSTRKKAQITQAKAIWTNQRLGEALIKLADMWIDLIYIIADPPSYWNLLLARGYFNWAYEMVSQIWDMSPILKRELEEVFATKFKYVIKIDEDGDKEYSEWEDVVIMNEHERKKYLDDFYYNYIDRKLHDNPHRDQLIVNKNYVFQ